MRSVTQGPAQGDDHTGETGETGGEQDQALCAHAREVVSRYLRLSEDMEDLKGRAAAAKKERDVVEPAVKEALRELGSEGLVIRGVGGVDLVKQRRKEVIRVEDYMRAMHTVDPQMATKVKESVNAKRSFTEKQVIRVVKAMD